MITYEDAVEINKRIVAARNREMLTYPENRFNINCVTLHALDNIWYNLLNEKIKAKFNYDRSNWIGLFFDNTDIQTDK